MFDGVDEVGRGFGIGCEGDYVVDWEFAVRLEW